MHPITQFFTGRMPFRPPNQQHQISEGIFQINVAKLLLLTSANNHVLLLLLQGLLVLLSVSA